MSGYSDSTNENSLIVDNLDAGTATVGDLVVETSLTISGTFAITGNAEIGGDIIMQPGRTVDDVDVSAFKDDFDSKVDQDVRVGSSPSFATITFPSSVPYALARFDPSGALDYLSLVGNGTIPIGSATGQVYAAQITGTNILIVNSAGGIAISIPQSVATAAAPTFAGLTLNGNLIMGTHLVDGVDISAFFADYSAKVDQDVRTGASPTFVGLTLSSDLITSSTIDGVDLAGFKADYDSKIDQELLITSTPVFAGLDMVGNIIMNGNLVDGVDLGSFFTITGSRLNQDVRTTASPTFVGMTLSADLVTSSTIDGVDLAAFKASYDSRIDQDLRTSAYPEFAGLYLRDTSAAFDVLFECSSSPALTAGVVLTLNLSDDNRGISLAGDLTLSGSFTTTGAFPITFATTGITSLTLPTAGTLASLTSTGIFTNKSLSDTTTKFVSAADSTKALMFDLSAATTGKTVTITSLHTVDRFWQLPDLGGTPTFVSVTGVQDLYSKDLMVSGSNRCRFVDATDQTKVLRMDVSGATTGSIMNLAFPTTGTKTLTFPDATDTMVGKATTDQFTNKSHWGHGGYSSDQPSSYSTGTAYQVGTAITGVGTTWTQAMAGGMLRFSTGEMRFISTFTSSTQLNTFNSGTVGSAGTPIAYVIRHGGFDVSAAGDFMGMPSTVMRNGWQIGWPTLTAADTMVLLTATQTVKNKKFDETNRFTRASDNTTLVQIVASPTTGVTQVLNFTSATSRTYNVTDAKADSDIVTSTRSTVTQITSLGTAVTCNGSSGMITTVSAAVAPGLNTTFRVNNSFATTTSVVLLTINHYTGSTGRPILWVVGRLAGSFDIVIWNYDTVNALNGVLSIGFLVT